MSIFQVAEVGYTLDNRTQRSWRGCTLAQSVPRQKASAHHTNKEAESFPGRGGTDPGHTVTQPE